MEADTIENIWHHTKCIDLLKGQNIIEIDSECSVSEGCEVIIERIKWKGILTILFSVFFCFIRFWSRMESHPHQFLINDSIVTLECWITVTLWIMFC